MPQIRICWGICIFPQIEGKNWFSISCSTSGDQPASASGTGAIYTISPASLLPEGESCTIAIIASLVVDQDGGPDPMAADFSQTYTIASPTGVGCGTPADLINVLQGTTMASPFVDQIKTIEGVVVGDYQASNQLNGFFVQEENEDMDNSPLTSEGLFVYAPNAIDVAVGQVVRVTGTVDEFFDLTELTDVTDIQLCGAASNPITLPAPASITFPVPPTESGVDYLERFEGMRVAVEQELFVTETFNLGRGGELLLSGSDRLYQPTNEFAPGAEADALAEANLLNQIVLDDGSLTQNPDDIIYPLPAGLSASNPVRGGDTVSNIVGLLTYSWSGWPSTNAYRIHPTEPATFTSTNGRPVTVQSVGGTLKVASFNVLNFFNGDGSGGGFPTSRGADTPSELERQKAKIISALVAIDADLIGLVEIENDGYGATSAIQELIDGLNLATGEAYAFVDPGVSQIGTDEIAVGFIYNTATINETGTAAILDSSIDPTFVDTKNRPALAQSFLEIDSGESFTVVVNHFKSKGSDCDELNDPDTGDGQGNCNLTRLAAANALTNWLATNPTGNDDSDLLIIGDLNAYAMEDPILAIEESDFTNLLKRFEQPYTYVFRGQWGSLDHGLANSTMNEQVVGAMVYHINADEARSLDYNEEFQSNEQIDLFYNSDQFRSSDHDPVLIGLDLGESDAPASLPTTIFLPISRN